MTSWDCRPDITPVGQAISWRAGLLLSIIVHVAMIIVLVLSPRIFPASVPAAPIDTTRPPSQPKVLDSQPAALLPSNKPASSAHAMPDGSLVDAVRTLERHTKPERFENTQGGAQTPSAWAAMELVGNHLWQSTLCLAVAALLTLVLRRNRARVRYAIWVAASVKFLVPFAPLMALGRQFGWRTSVTVVQPTMTVLMDTMSQPFSRPSTAIATIALPGHELVRCRRGVSTPAAGDLVGWLCRDPAHVVDGLATPDESRPKRVTHSTRS